MKVINFPQARREPPQEQAEAVARSLVEDFQAALTSTFLLADGSPVGLLTAQRILCRYWQAPSMPGGKSRACVSQRLEVAVLEEEERALSHELYLARRRLALLECPVAELDIIEHSSGWRGWVAAVDWAKEGYLVQVGRFGRLNQPTREGDRINLWGPGDLLGWAKTGRLSRAKACEAGWVERAD